MKRLLDVLLSTALLVITAPLLALAAVASMVLLGPPILFRQPRAGRNGRPFELYKLRTMRSAGVADGAVLPDEQRLTRLGRFLRATSIDELPQLWNVLKGEMSLVGPRPLLVEYLPLYSPEQARRHEVWPGITGWAQVNGRNAVTWEERLRMDVWYVDHQSVWLDLKILALTAWRVVTRAGIRREGTRPCRGSRGRRRARVSPTPRRRVLVYGSGGHGKVVAEAAACEGWEVIGLGDDEVGRRGTRALGWTVVAIGLDDAERVCRAEGASFVVAIGDNSARMRAFESLVGRGLEAATIVHPAAYVAPSATLGEGTVVLPGAVVHTAARLGRNAIVNVRASVDHDDVISDHAQIAPGATLGGNVHLGEGAMVALGAVVRNGIRIGEWAVVGAGAAAVKDVPARTTVVGIPARPTLGRAGRAEDT